MERDLHYKDVLLLPKYTEVDSRADVSVEQVFGGHTFRLPIVPANMKTVIDETLACWLAEKGYFYIMHRFGIDTIEFAQKARYFNLLLSISVGVNEDSYKIIDDLKALKIQPDFITIDIAHGHCLKMKKMIEYIKKLLPETFVIAGNVCTAEGTVFLNECGADAVKCGIASGKVCITKLQTGFSRPQFSAILDCAAVSEVPIIADGGAEEVGDLAKALTAGSSMIMVGNMLAGFEESPGKKIIYPDGRIVKEYFGSASEHNKGSKDYVEGRKIEIPYRGSIVDKLKEIEHGLRSSVSYAGGNNLDALRTVKWVISS